MSSGDGDIVAMPTTETTVSAASVLAALGDLTQGVEGETLSQREGGEERERREKGMEGRN